MHDQFHETAKWFATAGATLSTAAFANGDALITWLGVVLACGSALGSWYIAQRNQIRKSEREQDAADRTSQREQRWLDAFQEWQIEQMKKGVVQFPREPRSDAGAPDAPIPMPVPGPTEARWIS